MEPVRRLPILRRHSRESGNPVYRGIVGVTVSSPAFAGDDTVIPWHRNPLWRVPTLIAK